MNMPGHELLKLRELIHPLDDVMGFHLDIIENYTRKLDPTDKFEILTACKELKLLRHHMLETVTGLVKSLTRIDVEQEDKDKKGTRLAILQGKVEAFSLVAEIAEQQRQAIEEQMRQKRITKAKSTRPKKR